MGQQGRGTSRCHSLSTRQRHRGGPPMAPASRTGLEGTNRGSALFAWAVRPGSSSRHWVAAPALGGGVRTPAFPEWSRDGQLLYSRALGPDGVQGVYQVAAAGGPPKLLVRFDDPSQLVFPSAIVVGNGQFYFAIGSLESD